MSRILPEQMHISEHLRSMRGLLKRTKDEIDQVNSAAAQEKECKISPKSKNGESINPQEDRTGKATDKREKF